MSTTHSIRLLVIGLSIFGATTLTACGGDSAAPAPSTSAPASTAATPAPAAPAPAPVAEKADPHALMSSKGCIACHKVDAKFIGPSYQDVAKKYAGQADAKAYLTKKILDGGTGVWGAAIMTPNKGRISDEELSIMVDWILAGAK